MLSAAVSVGSFVSFVTAMLLLVNPIKNLADVATPITRGLAALDRGRRLLEAPAEPSGGNHCPARAQGNLQWQQVSLQYPGASRHALHQVSLNVQAGEVVALVGPSGAGKTSMVHLLPRFLHPTQGTVTLDGVPLADWDLVALRQQLALVAQDVVMFNDSVAANVALGDTPNLERVQQALQDANLNDWLQGLPNGVHSVVGHNAGELSGGQRQRVAIGRAIVRGPEVFLFDEPLSNLDAELRVEMRVEIARLHQEIGATMIYVTHDQVEAMTLADKIVVLRSGRVEQAGRPLELYNDPDNQFVAGFIGSPAMNFFDANAKDGVITVPAFTGLEIPAPKSLIGDRLIKIGLRPHHMSLTEGETHRVELSEQLGGVSYHYLVAPDGAKLIVEAHNQHAPRPGSMTGLTIKGDQALFFDSETGLRIR